MDSKCHWKPLFSFQKLLTFYQKHKTSLVVHTWKLVEHFFFLFFFFLLLQGKEVGMNCTVPKIFFQCGQVTRGKHKIFALLQSFELMNQDGEKSVQTHPANISSSVGLACHTFTFNAKIQQMTKTTSEVSNSQLQPWIHCKICSSVCFSPPSSHLQFCHCNFDCDETD